MVRTPGVPYRVAATATDLFDSGNPGFMGTLLGVKLTAAGAAATAQIIDADGTVLADLSCAIGGSDVVAVPIQFKRKVRVGTLTGAGAIVNAWVA